MITVTWNASEHIVNQIRSVFSGYKNISAEYILIDNNSSDGTVAVVETWHATSLPIRIIKNTNNIGFAAANNQGLKSARGGFLLFLNPDMRVQEGSLDKIIDWMKKHPDIGIAGCRLVDKNGNFNPEAGPRRFPKVWEMMAMALKLHHLFPSILNKYLMKDFNPEKEQEVDSVRGSFMLVRRELVQKLGWAFDPRYYIWFEDVDLCREAKRLGYKVVYTPIISCIDYVGQSFKKRDTYWKQKKFTLSMLKYFQKWEPWYKWVWIWLARPIGLAMAWVSDCLSSLRRQGSSRI